MTPQDKAKELVDKYLSFDFGLIKEYMPIPKGCAKQCAIIACEEVLQSEREHHTVLGGTYEYWLQVKNEISNL